MESPQDTLDLSLDVDAFIHSDGDLDGFKSPLSDDKNRVRFADEVDVNQFSQLGNSVVDDLFYASQDLAKF